MTSQILGLAIILILVLSVQDVALATCIDHQTPVQLPTLVETLKVIQFLNDEGAGARDKCKGSYWVDRTELSFVPNRVLSRHFRQWNIGCAAPDVINTAYALFKGDFRNIGNDEYLLAIEQGTYHADGFIALIRESQGHFHVISSVMNGDDVIPFKDKDIDDYPGFALFTHIGNPFLTKSCGLIFMNFVNETKWNVSNISTLPAAKVLWVNKVIATVLMP